MKTLWITACLAWAFALVATPVVAKMYKCVDAEGNVTYSQTQCPKTEKIEQVREQTPPPKTSVAPVVGSDGKRYYVESDSIDIKSHRPDDYYSPANQAKRMKRDSDARLEKKLAAERRGKSQRDYQKAVELNKKKNEEYREGRCRYYRSMARENYRSTHYKAKQNEFCD